MKPIRVLQVVTIMNRGGLETMLMNYYRKIDRDKIQFDFMTHRKERGDYDDEIESLGGKIYRMPMIRPGNYKNYFNKLDEFFNNHKEYRVVHSHINENSGFVLRAAKNAGVKCRIAHSHLSDLKLDYKYPFRLYGRMNLKGNLTEYFTCSKRAGEWLFGKRISDSGIIKTLNNAVDTEKFKINNEIRNRVRKELNIEGKKVIGHVGRFNPQKNHDFLIDIFNEIHKIDKDTVLILIGEGYLKKQIEEKVKILGLDKSVRFLGLRTDINELMQAMDLFLFPSLYEGLAVVLVEAQAAGLRCITSTGVTIESNITGNVEFMDLKMLPEVWAKNILTGNFEKKDLTNELIEKGYDSSTNVKWLVDFYSKEYA
ncbi:glycosyltransferase family 1 protein [Clostridium sp. NSJ-6]|uniref:Glycosyltransferase family 1 protein n=1 Tax=Clostridium hominis TaxID=2763036 RepID=A0ABR7DGM5_9CLOT|nr:glycosyltransferase family 1 protein [Clostridium hominis]MBC5630275.1 glycosyltransferase family 1 protein [Clostridium hominis]